MSALGKCKRASGHSSHLFHGLEHANIFMTDTMDVLDPESGAYDMKPVGLLSAAHGEEAERIPAIVNRPGVYAVGSIRYPAK